MPPPTSPKNQPPPPDSHGEATTNPPPPAAERHEGSGSTTLSGYTPGVPPHVTAALQDLLSVGAVSDVTPQRVQSWQAAARHLLKQ